MMAGKKRGENMKDHILPLRTRERIKRETLKLGRNTVIGKYAYRYIPETGTIQRISAFEIGVENSRPVYRESVGWKAIDYIE